MNFEIGVYNEMMPETVKELMIFMTGMFVGIGIVLLVGWEKLTY